MRIETRSDHNPFFALYVQIGRVAVGIGGINRLTINIGERYYAA